MKIHGIFVVEGDRVASTDGEFFPCGYVSCELPAQSIALVKSAEGQRVIMRAIRSGSLSYGHSVDGELLNDFLKSHS